MKSHIKAIAASALGLVLTACSHMSAQPDDALSAAAGRDREIYLSLVSAITDGGKPDAALAFLDDYLSQYPDDERALLLKGNAYLKTGDLDSAGKTYERLLEKGRSPVAEFGLGRVMAAQGDWRQAVSHLRLAYETSPADPKVLNDYGYALLETADSEQAYRLLGRAYELRPNDQVIRNNFVLAANRTGRADRVDNILKNLDTADQLQLKAFVAGWTAHDTGESSRPGSPPSEEGN